MRDMEKNTGPTPIAHMTPLEESKILYALNDADWSGAEVHNLTGKTFEEAYFETMIFEVDTCEGVIRLEVFNDCDEWDYVSSLTWNGRKFKCPLAADPHRCFEPLMTRAVTNWHPRMENGERWGEMSAVDCEHWT